MVVTIIGGPPGGEAVSTLSQLLGIYTNYSTPADVNFDGSITPLDALLIINALNEKAGSAQTRDSRIEELYFDVSDDLQISPLDALLVINQLNLRAASSLTGEGESISAAHDIALANLAMDVESETSWNAKRSRRLPLSEKVWR